MQIANALAGFSLGEADMLRTAMGKKKPEVDGAEQRSSSSTAREEREIAEGAIAGEDLRPDGVLRGLRLQQVAHAPPTRSSPTRPRGSRRTTPVEFMAALLTTREGNDRQARAVRRRVPRDGDSRSAARRQLLGRSTSRSKGRGVRFGLVGDQERRRGRDPIDPRGARADGRRDVRSISLSLARSIRGSANKRVLEALVQSGRARLARGAAEPARRRRSTPRSSGVRSAAPTGGGTGEPLRRRDGPPTSPGRTATRLPDLPDWDEHTRLAHEKATLGFYVTGHPLGEPSATCSTISRRTEHARCSEPPREPRSRSAA